MPCEWQLSELHRPQLLQGMFAFDQLKQKHQQTSPVPSECLLHQALQIDAGIAGSQYLFNILTSLLMLQ